MGFYKFFYIIFIAIALSACGGGGSNTENGNIESSNNPVSVGFNGQKISITLSPDGPGNLYKGVSGRTVLTESNANNIVDAVFSLYDFIVTENPISLTENSGNTSILNRTETVDGLVSGYYEISGNSNLNGTYHITTSWKDFNNGDGVTINGDSTFELIGHFVGENFEHQIETDKVITFKQLKITYNAESMLVDGSIRSRIEPSNYKETTIYNLDIYHSSTDSWLSLDDLKYEDNSDIIGRIYLSEYGFVDIDTKSTLKPCSYPYVCPEENYFFSEGAIQITGQSSHLDINASIYGARVTLNATPSTAKYYPWTNLSGSPLPNKEPVFSYISLDTDFYSDSPVILKYGVNDPEGELLKINIQWFINDQLLADESGNILPEHYISPGDSILARVFASDGVTSSEKSKSIEIKQARIFSDTSKIIHSLNINSPEQLDAIDLDNDGLKDIVYIDRDPRSRKVTLGIVKQEFGGEFSAPTLYEITEINELTQFLEAKLIIKDLNNDELLDIVIHTDASLGGWELVIFKQNQGGTFIQTDTLLIPHSFSVSKRSIEIVDIYKDNSSLLEVVVISSFGNNGPDYSFDIIPLKPDLTFNQDQSTSQDIKMEHYSYHNDVALIDKNGDGHLDILFSSYDFSSGETIFETILQNSSTHSFEVRNSNTEYVITRGKILLLDDLNNDSRVDLVLNSVGGFKIFYQNELGNFIFSNTELTYSSSTSATSDSIELRLNKLSPFQHEIIAIDTSCVRF